MTLIEIKAAIAAGKTVHWQNELYTVIKDNLGQYLIECKGNYWGLTWQDGKTLNGNPSEFYIAGEK